MEKIIGYKNFAMMLPILLKRSYRKGRALPRLKDTQMVFFEIIADRGAHAKNCGYWIVGKHDDKWVMYVSIDSLVNMGYTPWEWHQIKTEMNSDATGRFILISSHEYMPPGAQFGYQLKHAVDLKLQLFWDKEAGWFGIRRLE